MRLLLPVLMFAGLAGVQPLPEPRVLTVARHTDAVEFESPVDLPWEALARSAFSAADFERPGRALLEKFFFEPGGNSDVPFRVPLPDGVPRGPYLGLSVAGSSLIQVSGASGTVRYDTRPPAWEVSGRSVPAGQLRGVSEPASAAPVLFVLWAAPLPALSLRTATAVAAGSSLRVVVPRAGGAQTWFVGSDEGWDVVRPTTVRARIFVDGTTGLTYLLASAEMGEPPCPTLAVLYDVSTELRLVGRTASCDP